MYGGVSVFESCLHCSARKLYGVGSVFHLAAAIMGVLIRVSPADRYYAAGSSAVGRSTAPVKRQKGWAGRALLQRRVEGGGGNVVWYGVVGLT